MLSANKGQLVGYRIHCEETVTKGVEVVFRYETELNKTVLTLTKLTPFTKYTCLLSALTSRGEGKASKLTWQTAEEGEQWK